MNYADSGEWDLIGSPVDGLSISDFGNYNTAGATANGSFMQDTMITVIHGQITLLNCWRSWKF